MARRHDDDETGTDFPSRRTWMKALGAAAVSLPAFGAGNAAASNDGADAENDYETVTVSSGETARFRVGSGETLENLLIDVTASGADAQIVASGTDWTVRNVGFRGRVDVDGEVREWARLWVSGTGTIERLYLGDGSVGGVRSTGGATRISHSGHVDFIACHFAEWPDNAFYASHSAEPTGGGGTVHFQDCYFRDNNVSHLRIAADGDRATGCVVHNTGNVPELHTGAVDSKGVFTYYGDPGQTVHIRDCQIDVTSGNTNGGAAAFRSDSAWSSSGGTATTIAVEDTEYRGEAIGEYVDLRSGNGNDPRIEIPEDVPVSAEDAASGPDDEEEEEEKEEHVITISDELGWSQINYEFTVGGDLERSTDMDATIDDWNVVEGSTASGHVWGWRDSYRFTGELEAFEMDGPATVYIDGEEIDPMEYMSDLPEFVTIYGDQGRAEYEFTVSGDLERSLDMRATIDDWNVVEGSTASGHVWGWRDSYRFTGEIEDFDLDGDARVFYNGEEVDPDSL